MELFEKIYKKSSLLRLQEARALNTIDEIYKALKKDDSGRRYIETLLNGKKNLPEWFRTLADNDNLDLIKQPLEALINRFKSEPKNIINDAICLLFRKSDSIDTLKSILKNSIDTLVQYAKNAKTQWISKLNSYNNVMTQKYNPDIWHAFEKEIQNFKTKRNVIKGKELSTDDKNALYDTLYEDDNWGLYVPKTFEGDSELASHIKEFESNGETLHKTQWCTAAQPEYFNHYSEDGKKPLYVIKYFESGFYTEAWQIAFMDDHIELMDKRDERNFDFLFKNAPMEIFNKIIDKPIETESYIFPLLVKKYNESTDNFDLDEEYSYYHKIFLKISIAPDDVKTHIGKDVSIEEIIETMEGLKDYRTEPLNLRYKFDINWIVDCLLQLKENDIPLGYFIKIEKDLGWFSLKNLIEYIKLLEKGEVPDFSKIPDYIADEQTFESTDRGVLKLMAKDIRDGIIPDGLSPQAYLHFGRENLIDFFKYKEMGAFDDTATIQQFIEYGAQNLNDINVLKHQGRLWPTLNIEDCFQLGAQRAIDISKELFSSNLPKNIKLEDYWTFNDNLNFLRLYGKVKEKLIENQVDDIDEKGLLSADSFYTFIMRTIRDAIDYEIKLNGDFERNIEDEDIPFDIIEDTANKISDNLIYEQNHPETQKTYNYYWGDDEDYEYISFLEETVDIARLIRELGLEDDEE